MDPANRSVSDPVLASSRTRWWQRPRAWSVIWIGWFITLCILSSMSHPGPRLDIVGIDKVYHAVYFALGGTALLLALGLRGKNKSAVLTHHSWGLLTLIACLVGAVVGWFDEWHQSYTPGRSGLDVHDWLADIAGSLAAVPLTRGVFFWFARHSGRSSEIPHSAP